MRRLLRSELKRRALIKAALSRHGLAGASEAKKRRLVAAAEAEADEALALSAKRARISEANVEADDLKGENGRQRRRRAGGRCCMCVRAPL